ncbi:hypothetical protein HG531_011462 [Fusarium graminearum]|nr:hypothetical protein HG531_011462 [Fusarium graminearum]
MSAFVILPEQYGYNDSPFLGREFDGRSIQLAPFGKAAVEQRVEALRVGLLAVCLVNLVELVGKLSKGHVLNLGTGAQREASLVLGSCALSHVDLVLGYDKNHLLGQACALEVVRDLVDKVRLGKKILDVPFCSFSQSVPFGSVVKLDANVGCSVALQLNPVPSHILKLPVTRDLFRLCNVLREELGHLVFSQVSTNILGEQNTQEVVESPTDDLGNLDRDLLAVLAGPFKVAFDLATMTAEAGTVSTNL